MVQVGNLILVIGLASTEMHLTIEYLIAGTTFIQRGVSMWQDDTVYTTVKQETNTLGSIDVTWIPTAWVAIDTPWQDLDISWEELSASTIMCDVQDVSKELAFREWGMTLEGQYKQVFDHANSAGWQKGNQVYFNGEFYWVMLVNRNMDKMGASNHTFIVLLKVI